MKSGAGRGATGRMEQEKRQKMLAEYCKTRDVGLRNELVTEYMYLADMVARKYAGRGVEYDDLKQIAAMALIGALERFSCDKGIQFSTFAVPSMTGVVKNYFRDRSRIIRMPRTIGGRARPSPRSSCVPRPLGRSRSAAAIPRRTSWRRRRPCRAFR